jgi:cobalt-zinc-cadmium resistance protein CzcA
MILAAFGDSRLAGLVFAGVPLALVGGVLGLWIRGLPFSISAGVGFIALAGISVLNGVVLVSTSLRYKEEGMDPIMAVVNAAKNRVRPVLMTALVEVFGFLPMMFASGRGAEVQRPLATVVVCGVISATVLTLLMLPSWQVWLEKRSK